MYKCNWYSRPGVNYSDKGEGAGGKGRQLRLLSLASTQGLMHLLLRHYVGGGGRGREQNDFGEVIVSSKFK